jgi:hypothetical protein
MVKTKKRSSPSRKIRRRRQIGGTATPTPNTASASNQAPAQAPAQAPTLLQQQGGNAGQISQETMDQASKAAQQILGQMMNGQAGASSSPVAVPQLGGGSNAGVAANASPLEAAMVGGAAAGAIAAAETHSTLTGSPLAGGRKRRGSKQQKTKQTGGMVPGLMTAVETALVPLGLYIGQKALQARSGRNGSSRVYSPYDQIRSRFSRGTRRRRSSRK